MFDASRRPSGRFFYWLLAMVTVFGVGLPALGAPGPDNGPATTTVADTVYLADGTTAQGNLIITWPAFVTASGTAVASGSKNVALGANGALSVALVPNAGASPTGVYYTVVYQIGSGQVKTEDWMVPTTSPANLATVRTTPGAGVAGQAVSMQYVNSALATKANDSAVVHLGGTETISGAKVFASAPSVPMPTSSGQVATKGYVDQSISSVGAGSYLPTAGGTLTGALTLQGNPSTPLQAAPKQYVDLGLTSKADLISGVVPANELGTGSANAGSCLLGNGTWGACGSGGGTGNVSTNPITGVSQNITQGVGTQFSTNNLAGIPYVVASYNWPQAGMTESCTGGCTAGGLVAGTQATITLTPCPAGIDTSNNANGPYGVYISGTGTAEAVAVTGGSCTSGASSGTIIFKPGSSHGAGFTVGSASGGNQEAINIADNTPAHTPFAVIQEVPANSNSANYNIYWPVYLNPGKSLLNGYGALWQCYTRSICLMVGNYASATTGHNTVAGLTFEPALNVDGAQISSVSATAGLYTVTTASNHNLMAGDWVILYYSTPAQTQEARVQVLASGLTSTQFQYSLGSTTFATSSGFGWAAIENAAIEDETDGLKLVDIKFQGGPVASARFHEGVVVDNDQDFVIDGMTNLGGGGTFRANANFVGNMVYIRGDQGAAAVPYIHHLEASMQCGGNGIRNVAGNTMHVTDSVIQGTSQYSIYYGNGMNPWEIDNVYYETGSCTNPAYAAGAYAAEAGFISNTGSSLTIQGNAPIGGAFPSFASGGGAGSQRNYYIVAHDSNRGTSPLLAIGTAQPATGSTSIPLYWPNMDLSGGGTRTWDIVVTMGNNPTSAPYTGNAFSVATNVAAVCNTAGICTYTDTQGATSAYTVTNTSWVPSYWFWPGSFVLGRGATLYIDQAGQTGEFIPSSYLPQVFAKRCPAFGGGTTYYSPTWMVCYAGDSVGNGNPKVGAQLVQIGAASGSLASGVTGGLTFEPGPGVGSAPRQIITTMDGSPQQTIATPGYVRTGSAADSFIGTDTTGNVGTQDQTYGAPGGHNFYVNDPGTNAANAKFSILSAGATFRTPVTFNAGVTFAGITGAAQCLHVSATGVVTGTGSDCGSGGGGSGTVNSGGASQVAMYSASGAAVSGDSGLTDSGTVLNYAGSGGITAASGTFSGNLTVNGQLQVAGPWMVSSPIPGTGMIGAGTGASALGISNDGNFYISTNGGSPQKVATTATSSYFSNLWQEDANTLGVYSGASPQGLHVYGTYPSTSNYERTGLGWDPSSTYFVLRNENAGTGVQRGIGFWIGSGIRWAIDTQSAFKPFMTNSFDIGVVNPSQLVPRTVYAATSFDTLTQGRLNFELCNDSTTGTALNFLAAYNSASPACVVKAGSSNTDGVVGVVSNGSGTTGNAVITYRGYALCSFDGSTVSGDYVVTSTTNPGDCHDAGAARPAGMQVIGRVESTNTGTGTYGIRAALESPLSAMAPNTTSVPWIPTAHYGTGISFSTTAAKAIFTGVILTFPKTTTQVTYLVSAADTSANTYDIGIYSGTSGGTCTQVTHTGPTPGSTFSPTSSWKTLSWVGGAVTLQPGRYYLAYTTSCTASCATMGGDGTGMTFAGSIGGANSNVNVTTGGTLPASVICPTDTYTATSMPNWAIN